VVAAVVADAIVDAKVSHTEEHVVHRDLTGYMRKEPVGIKKHLYSIHINELETT
jgi:hypothetical protein